ncbi:HNH endonuclease [Listeria monocytogenes]|jgi:hypothetical protein|uniref:HNH endonuclease n=1 Tax=Streptococcus dysgalactiae subsp. dysgalactiae TaxID=99822 RepID=A0A9X7X8K7_STRDY|nr:MULTISPECIES: HNH endonuclease [Lactobacillales]QGH02294.1 hypothetical protein EA457_06950 [Streptococcus dysgalactiae subsp. dysgalactiae]RBR38646.1 hypothetical protein EA75_01943 [Enterococcus faecalis]WHL24317.1 HNH endonuclease [Streptococcus iniae]HAA3488460.1 hypothetical protein [Listeria monocytogenes]
MAEKEIILDGNHTGWKISDEGYTIDTWGRKSFGTLNRTAGYLQVAIRGKKYLIHRLVAMFFIPFTETNPDGTPLNGKAQVNHKNENPFDNRLENLEWCDNTYNNNYGTKKQRVSLKTAKFYKCIETGEIGQPVFFAVKYGLTKQAIRNAANPNDFHKHASGLHFEREEIIA